MSDLMEIAAQYFDPLALREGPRRLYRFESAGLRFYYTVEAGEAPAAPPEARLFPSVTTVIRQTTPTPPFLLKWIAEHGQRRAEQLREERAAYGTLMHILFARLLIEKKIDLATLPSVIASFAATQNLGPAATSGWEENLGQDLVGFADFSRETRLRPIGIEVPLASEQLGYAGCLDLVAELDVETSNGRGRPKTVSREIAYIDWKSNRTTFYEESRIQTHAYRTLWNEQFPEIPITRVLLYGARNWSETSRDRYRLEDTTNLVDPRLFPNLLEQFQLRNEMTLTRVTVSGVVSLDRDPDENVTVESIETYLARHAMAA